MCAHRPVVLQRAYMMVSHMHKFCNIVAIGAVERERERERELHLSSHTKLMQVLPGHPLADQEYTVRGRELHVRQILSVTTLGLKDRKASRHNTQSEGVNYK